jgi:hypothetical protein
VSGRRRPAPPGAAEDPLTPAVGLRAWFAEAGLTVPQLPAATVARLRRREWHWWSTLDPDDAVGAAADGDEPRDFLAAVLDGSLDDALVIGRRGGNLSTGTFHLRYADERVVMVVTAPFANTYGDPAAEAETLAAVLDGLGRLRASAGNGRTNGVIDPDERLAVVWDGGRLDHRWAIVGPGYAEWERGRADAVIAAAVASTLRAPPP